MKNLKLIYVSIVMLLFTMASCSNSGEIVDSDTSLKSLSAKASISQLKTHFNSDGTLNTTNNRVGNILFDFGFNFVYPITLSYNTGASVTVTDFDKLIAVMTGMTDTLYIDGISFPFSVEVFDKNTGTISIQVISNEQEFEDLLNNTVNSYNNNCVCTQDYTPVCVEIQDPINGNFIIEFPNACIAECEGFTQNNFVDCGNSNFYQGSNNNSCFNFVYPISVVNASGNITILNSVNEWDNFLFTTNEVYDFVYPFNVTLISDNSVQTIVNEVEFIDILASCYGCNCPATVDPVCVTDPNGGIIEYDNMCLAECDGFTQNDVVACSTNSATCWAFNYPINISTSGAVVTANTDAEVDAIFSDPTRQAQLVYPIEVVIDGVTSTLNTPNDFFDIGDFANQCD